MFERQIMKMRQEITSLKSKLAVDPDDKVVYMYTKQPNNRMHKSLNSKKKIIVYKKRTKTSKNKPKSSKIKSKPS